MRFAKLFIKNISKTRMSKMKKVTYNKLKKVVESKGYKFFTGKLNVNLIGVRTERVATNEWDDSLYVAYEDEAGKKVVINFGEFTTDPGFKYLQETLLNKLGCAILKEDQHRGIWQLGKHQGKYSALVQRKACEVYRDKNRDTILDTGVLMFGIFGINLHHGASREEVGPYSAGCQVLKKEKDLEKLLDICKKSATLYGNSFSYTLLLKEDLNI